MIRWGDTERHEPQGTQVADSATLVEGIDLARNLVVRITTELREWDVPDEGDVDIWWRGYDLHDENDRGWHWDDPELRMGGIVITKIAGVQYYPGMTLETVGPGRPLRLILEPENPYDPNAVAIWDAAGEEKVGHLPRDVAASVSEILRAERPLAALCIAELIEKPGDRRCGLRVLLAPPGLVEGWPSSS